jgi:hypothetical protein
MIRSRDGARRDTEPLIAAVRELEDLLATHASFDDAKCLSWSDASGER